MKKLNKKLKRLNRTLKVLKKITKKVSKLIGRFILILYFCTINLNDMKENVIISGMGFMGLEDYYGTIISEENDDYIIDLGEPCLIHGKIIKINKNSEFIKKI